MAEKGNAKAGANSKGLIDAAKNELVGGPRNGSKNACE
jgi:hypothetical protein